jgi:hypothetical protein
MGCMVHTQPIEREEEEYCASVQRTGNFTNEFIVPGYFLRDLPRFVITYGRLSHGIGLQDRYKDPYLA